MAEDDTTTANRDIVRRVLNVFNTGDMSVLDELVSADFVNHDAPPGAPQGRDGRKRAVAMFRAAFSDFRRARDDFVLDASERGWSSFETLMETDECRDRLEVKIDQVRARYN